MTRSGVRSDPAFVGVALLVLAFAAGVGSGVVADRLAARGSVAEAHTVQDMSGVLDQLVLSDQQRRQAQVILNRETPRSERAMVELAARLRSISDSVDSELRVILTPAQRIKLDSLRHPLTFILKHEDSSGASRVDTVYPRAKY
ncbi:MAG: hypothetical protein M3R65_04080 [Gemmatimonadota bacterium]|nr:hypothetical protein [Gemmatimonadota bacterium]